MKLATSNLPESIFLHCHGMCLAEVLCDNRGKITFLYEDSLVNDGELAELQELYCSGQATVNITEYEKSMKKVKQKMFKVKRKYFPVDCLIQELQEDARNDR